MNKRIPSPARVEPGFALDMKKHETLPISAFDSPLGFIVSGMCQGDEIAIYYIVEDCDAHRRMTLIRCGCRMALTHKSNFFITPFPGNYQLVYNRFKSNGVTVYRMAMPFPYSYEMAIGEGQCCFVCENEQELPGG